MKPLRIAILIWCAIALLGLLCLFLPERMTIGDLTLRWTSLPKVLGESSPAPDSFDFPYTLDTLALADIEDLPEDTLDAEEDIVPAAVDSAKSVAPVVPEVEPVDASYTPAHALAKFYAALAESSERTVRVVHYGDSQIEEDRMTTTLRCALQACYGGGGVGLIPLHQTIPTRTVKQVLTVNGVRQTTQQGPKRNLVYGPKAQRRTDGLYGVMGQVATVGKPDSIAPVMDSLSLTLSPMSNRNKWRSENYFDCIRIWADGTFTGYVNGKRTPVRKSPTTVHLPDSTTHCTIDLAGCGAVYGISLETETGVIVDNVPMRGSIGTVFMDIDSTQLADFYRETNTHLIIMQFGGNAIPHNEKPGTIQGVVQSLRRQVRYLKRCAPEASILFVGPGDMCTMIDGEMTTYPLLPYMDNLLAKMAEKEHIAYFSLYQAMGGKDSMLRWQKNGWAGSDGVHFTRRGSEIAGEKLAAFILDGLEE